MKTSSLQRLTAGALLLTTVFASSIIPQPSSAKKRYYRILNHGLDSIYIKAVPCGRYQRCVSIYGVKNTQGIKEAFADSHFVEKMNELLTRSNGLKIEKPQDLCGAQMSTRLTWKKIHDKFTADSKSTSTWINRSEGELRITMSSLFGIIKKSLYTRQVGTPDKGICRQRLI